jgi:hypothetical protein
MPPTPVARPLAAAASLVMVTAITCHVVAQQSVGPPLVAQPAFTLAPLVAVHPIEPPTKRLPSEADSAGQTRFSFIAYGDTRSAVDGQSLQPEHGVVADAIVAKIEALASSSFPVRFVLQTGDAVLNGTDGAAWNISFSPIIERITRRADVPYFLAAGNHDVGLFTGARTQGLHNMLSALSRLIPEEGSPRRLSGYPTYAFGYGQVFVVAIDSNIAADPLQLTWVTDQLEHLDRNRYRHLIVFFHHPPFSSGPHGGATPGPSAATGDSVEPATAAIRSLYAPLFRRFHVRMSIGGHDHLYDHWIERYRDGGATYRRDDVVTGGGGAPTYVYRGEPAVNAYLAEGAAAEVRLEHTMRPGSTAADNPNHFVLVQVDGDRLSLQVNGTGPTEYKPYGGTASRVELDDPR